MMDQPPSAGGSPQNGLPGTMRGMPDATQPQGTTPKPPLPEWMKMSLASAGGMATSFAAFLAVTTMQTGAGDPSVNRQYPTALNSFQASLTGENAIASAMSSYVWWTGVIVGGVVMTWLFLRLLRNRAA
jgi:hypothetical protein